MVAGDDEAAEGVVVAETMEEAATEDIDKAGTINQKMTKETGIITRNISRKTYSAT